MILSAYAPSAAGRVNCSSIRPAQPGQHPERGPAVPYQPGQRHTDGGEHARREQAGPQVAEVPGRPLARGPAHGADPRAARNRGTLETISATTANPPTTDSTGSGPSVIEIATPPPASSADQK